MFKPWKMVLLVIGCIGIVVGGYYGYSMLKTDLASNQASSKEKIEEKTLTDEDVAQFTQEEEQSQYENVGRFIGDFHTRYNKTLGYGGINSVKWTEQKKIAENILSVMENIHTENEALKKDFEVITQYAQEVQAGKQRTKTLRNLHRYFHDLDIEFNGYTDTSDHYNITEYKSGR